MGSMSDFSKYAVSSGFLGWLSDIQSVLAGPSGSRLPTALQTLPQEPDSAPLNPALLSLPTWAKCALGWPASVPKGTSPPV